LLDKLPKSVQSNAHRDLREILMAPNRAAAQAAIDVFAAKYAPKYRNAVDCLIKGPRELLTFYGFPEPATQSRACSPPSVIKRCA
jgi:transposase-like protein